MTDALRSRIMRAVKARDTSPERFVRKLVHRMGFRFRLHRADLPGKPDLVFPGRRAIIFVHGCFWHGHGCKRGARIPTTNRDYWVRKIARNSARDATTIRDLNHAEWRTMVVWECELKTSEKLRKRIERFLIRSNKRQ
jgi:DNA mismatch endonuclease (patch repair protein)